MSVYAELNQRPATRPERGRKEREMKRGGKKDREIEKGWGV